MERAGRLIARLKLPAGSISPEEMARRAWPAAVGKRIAARTRPIQLAGSRLLVEVEDGVWERQLAALKRQILDRLSEVIGASMVADIEFRVAVPRRPPQRQEKAPAVDEAERIEDPVLREIYREQRKRESA